MGTYPRVSMIAYTIDIGAFEVTKEIKQVEGN